MEELHVYFSGKVQGVFFRANTKKVANALGVTGWVRNLPDGRVEAVFSGKDEIVDAVVDAVIDGQKSARVDDIETEIRESGVYEDFKIQQ